MGPAALLALVFMLDLWGPSTNKKSEMRAVFLLLYLASLTELWED